METNITVNGKRESIGSALVLTEYLRGLGLNPETVVVERNGVILRPEEFASTRLQEADCLEIIHFVGGG